MPLTLPTHPLAVAPLKLWRPRWFDGVALTLGAIAPDVPFALDGYPVVVRPSFVLGGRAMAIVYDEQALDEYMRSAVDAFVT